MAKSYKTAVKQRKTAIQRRKTAKKGRKVRRRRGRWWRWIAVLLLLLGGVLAWLIWPFWQLSGQFGHQPTKQPSRLYGVPTELRLGAASSARALADELESLSYRRATSSDSGETPTGGTFRATESEITIFRRRFPPPNIDRGRDRLRVAFRNGVISRLEVDGAAVKSARLDPPLVASYYDSDLRERRPVVLDDLPEELILAVLAAEDAYFLEHVGFSFIGTLRAAWVNLRAREVRQGGSTLTQQLVKNLYLTQRRTLLRKLQEVVLAVFLEMRYSKDAILQAYLNEIYWGRSGSVDLMGIGAAAWAYFGKHPSQLDLGESALLAGIIPAPATLSPIANPDAARERRNAVLGRLAQLGWLATDRLERASKLDVEPPRGPLIARRAPYFAAVVEAEARRRFGIAALADAGYVLHSTLSIGDQEKAEEAVRWGVETLEKGREKDRKTASPLEAALISADPRTGAIRAYVGGRNFARSQFDRVTKARRQAGSAFKPIVYATAFADRLASPVTFLEDAPLSVHLAGQEWSPRNSDSKYRGWITARAALEQSLNVPTARLALEVGLDRVVETARRMGVTAPLDPYPALALGAMEVSPVEMATVYATLAAGGRRPTLHTLTSVHDRLGAEVAGQTISTPVKALDENVAWVVNKVLQGVLDRGTAKNARQQNIVDPLAGKTGTTNDRRDSWFAGYSPERMSLVWVGYDDNSKTRLSGARAALPIWSRFTFDVRPQGGYSDFVRPKGAVTALIDPTTGGLATDRCTRWVEEAFLADFTPALCPDHSGWRARPLQQPDDIEVEKKKHPFKRWLEMLKGKKRKHAGAI